MAAGPSVIFGIAGACLVLLGLWELRKLRASMSWPQVTGTIVFAGLKERLTDGEDGLNRNWYTPRVQYQYVVDGVTLVGSRIAHLRRGYARPRKAQAELALYTIGSPVVVYFNPRKPADAVLVRKAPRANVILCAGIIILLAVLAAALPAGPVRARPL